MEFKDSLLAFKQDIEHRGLVDWLEAHTSFMRPLHRYAGVLDLNHERIYFTGKDEKAGDPFEMTLKIDEITGVHLGYDHVFKRIEDRSLGIFHFVPLRVDFLKEGKADSIYVFANYSRLIRQSDNQKLYDELNLIRPFPVL